MLIGDILAKMPRAAEIMEDYGLHCTSCSVNAFEPVKAGAMTHGLAEETVDEMISELNSLFMSRPKAPKDGIYLTERAARMVNEFAANENKAGWALKVTAKNNDGKEPAYLMDFQEKAGNKDKVFAFHGVEIFIDPESLKNMLGAEIDFLETQFGNGFKIENPNFKDASCCSGGSCAC